METSQFQNEFSQVSKLIQQKQNILLAIHEHPDGDALGSMIAMFSILRRFPDKKIVMFSRDPVPENFKFLPYCKYIVHDISQVSKFPPDLFLGFDYGDFYRLGIEEKLIENAAVVTFDHHPFLKQKGDILIIDNSASSTCEIMYNFFRKENYDI